MIHPLTKYQIEVLEVLFKDCIIAQIGLHENGSLIVEYSKPPLITLHTFAIPPAYDKGITKDLQDIFNLISKMTDKPNNP